MMFRQNSRNFPTEIMEAARVDGVSEFGIFWKIYMPIMKATYAAAAVITFMNAWNSYLWPKVVMTDNRAQTMPMLIANLSSGYVTDYGELMMGVLFCSVPTMVIFFILQKQFAEGIFDHTGAVHSYMQLYFIIFIISYYFHGERGILCQTSITANFQNRNFLKKTV